jgi:hypothetical protein
MPSGSRLATTFLALVLFCSANSPAAEKKVSREVRSYLGGIPFLTEGSLPDGTCFRIAGRATNPDFFTTLTSTDEKDLLTFRRGSQVVVQFPAMLSVVYAIRDQPCSYEIRPASPRSHLTQESIDKLHVSLYWKHNMKLRPVEYVSEVTADVTPILPYAKDLAQALPKHFEWTFQLNVESRGVPLTDSLILIFRLPNGWTAARVSARL